MKWELVGGGAGSKVEKQRQVEKTMEGSRVRRWVGREFREDVKCVIK
jgi:hypothetical protein